MAHRRPRVPSVALAAALAVRSSGAAAALVEHIVAPKDTDAAISQAIEDHYAYVDPSLPATGQLFVFFAGTGGTPRVYRLILQEGARNGFPAIGLRYPNAEAVGDLCSGSADPGCHAKVRQEILEGIDASPLVNVPRPDSIESRLSKLLAYLNARFPSEGWGAFLKGGLPDWSRIRVAGHSQGGGHAAFIAKDHLVAGVGCFASPGDWDSALGKPASWTFAPHVTPAAMYFGFSHLRDELVTWPLAMEVWSALGFAAFGPPVSIDGADPPYGGGHQLSTNLPLPSVPLATFHNMPVVDVHTPRGPDGTPLYLPVWRTVCFAKGAGLLLSTGRVAVTATWRDPYSGRSGEAAPLPQDDAFGYFHFGDPGNPEVFVKVLDFGPARPFLLFAAGLTDFEYEVTWRNVRSGQTVSFLKPAGSFDGFADVTTLVH